MDTHTTPPTGRRKITLPQLRAEAAGAVPFLPTSPGRALAAFKRGAPALGVSRRVVDLVDCLMSYSPPQDWDGSPGLGPIVWPSDAELEDRLDIGPSQRKVIVRAALDAGFMRLRRSPTGKRWGHRDKAGRDGRILNAYGFDLAPLAERAAEFERLAADWEVRRDEGRRLRREITCSRNHVLSLVDLAVAQGLEGTDWTVAAVQTDSLWRERGSQRDPLPLVPIAEQEKSSDGWVAQPMVPLQSRVGPTRESEMQANALRGFVVTAGFILTIAPAFRDWISSARAGWDELDQAAAHVRSALGISPHAWGQACIVLGTREAITALAAISARHAAGDVRSPGGLLRKMVELHQTGRLRLDRTLFGLAEKATGGRRQNAGMSSRPAVPSGASHEPS